MAIFVGCAPSNACNRHERLLKGQKQIAIKLDGKLLDACVDKYEFPPDNRADPGLAVP
jgi:hypothetical protein